MTYIEINAMNKFNNEQKCVPSTRMPHSHYHFLCLVDSEIGVKTLNLALKLERSYNREHVYCFKLIGLQLYQKLPTKNFNLKWKERTDKQTNERTHRPENIMPLYYRRWGIKITELNIPVCVLL